MTTTTCPICAVNFPSMSQERHARTPTAPLELQAGRLA